LEKSEKIVVVDQNSHCQMAHLVNVIPNLQIFVAPNGAIVAAMTSTATVQPVLTTNCHQSTCEQYLRLADKKKTESKINKKIYENQK